MKLACHKPQEASVLIVSLLTCMTIGIVLASFLALVSSRHKLTVRSMAWNAAIPVSEAGIEDALTHLNVNVNNLEKDGWQPATIGGQLVLEKQPKTLPDGSFYRVAIHNAYSNNPVVYSQGFFPSHLRGEKYLSRTVRVDVTNAPNLFIRAITTQKSIKFGGNVLVDSYNSDLGGYSTATNRNAGGNIATAGSGPGVIDLQNSRISGTAQTGPQGTVITGPGGCLGDLAWNTSGQNGVQPGSTNNNFNAAFYTNKPPSGPFLTPTVVSSGVSNITQLGTDYYQMPSLNLSKDTHPLVVNGKATLWVTGNLTVSGNGIIQLLPGASLTLYVGGVVSLGGEGVANGSGLPSQFTIVGLASCTNVTYGGKAVFIGGINAPQADVTMAGTSTLFGAVIAKSFTSVGVSSVHYDEAMARARNLLVARWREL